MTPETQAILERARQRQTPGSSPMQPASTDDILERARQRQQESRSTDAPGLLSRAGSAIAGAARGVRDMVVGQHDPNFADVPAFSPGSLPLDVQAGINRGQTVTFDDEAYGDVVRRQLGNRYIRTERDENGYQIITYRDAQGQERREYLNRPGLDWQDVDRALAGSVPFMVGAGVANLGLGAAGAGGLLARFGAHAGAAGTASIASDQVARGMGSEQGTDLARAGIAALGGGVFEGLSGPIVRTWNAIFRRGGVGPDGRLTGDAAEAARRAGLDPSDMNERLAREFERDLRIGASPEEIAGKFRAGEFGIPTTYGQRAKDPASLGAEEEMRRGLMGREAQSIMTDFDRRQTQAIEGAVYDSIGNRIAPNAAGRDVRSLGESIRGGAQSARRTLDAQEDAVWARVTEMYPQQGAFASMPGILRKNLDEANIRPDPKLTPATHSMMRQLEHYARGKTPQSQYALLPEEVRVMDIDSMRRRLLATQRAAQPGSPDAVSARAVYNSFNDWIDEAAERALLSGSPDTAAALRAARGFTREVKELFQPTRDGRATPAARRISNVMDNADSGEGVVRALFGEGSPVRTPPDGSVDALRHMREMLIRTGQEQAWDDIRMAYWIKIAQDNRGRVLTPGRLKANIDGAFARQGTVMDLMFSSVEQSHMRRLSSALGDVVYTPPNPSGTSYELERMRRAAGGEPIMKTILSTQAKRELFSKGNVLMARIYMGLAKRIPNVAGVKDAAGGSLAKSAISQEVRPRRPGSGFIAPIGAIGAVQSTAE